MRGFLFVLELLLPLQCFDESFLGEILGIRDIAHHAVNLHEDAPQVVGDKPVLSFDSLERRGQQFAHDLAIHDSRTHNWMTPGPGKRGDYFAR